MNQKAVKIISLLLVVVVVLNIILFSFHRINVRAFWSIILVAAVYTYFVLPKVKKKV